MPILRVTTPDGLERSARLESGRRSRVGSDARCSVRLASGTAEPVHCEVFYESGLWHVRDLTSATGTLLNGERVKTAPLADGDVIEVGQTRMTFQSTRGLRQRSRRTGTPGAPSRVPASSRRAPRRAATRALRARRRSSWFPLVAVAGVLVVGIAVAVTIAGHQPETPGEAASSDQPDPAGLAHRESGREKKGVPETELAGDTEGVLESARVPESANPLGNTERVGEKGSTPPATRRAPEGDDALASSTGADHRNPAQEPGADRPTVREESPAAAPPGSASPSTSVERSPIPQAAREDVLLELCALDFEQAARILAALRERTPDSGDLTALDEEYRELRRTWQELRERLEALVRSRKAIEIPKDTLLVPMSPGDGPLLLPVGDLRHVRLGEIQESEAALEERHGSPIGRFHILSLPDAVLAHATSGPTAEPDRDAADFHRRLGRLLLHTEGPERSARFLRSVSPSPLRLDATELDREIAGGWLKRKSRSLTRLRSEVVDDVDGPTAAAWAAVGSRVLSTLLSLPPELRTGEAAKRLREDFHIARERSLPETSLFHSTTSKRLGDGRIELVYDFSKRGSAETSLRDFVPIEDGSEALRVSKGRLLARGEYRFLDGDPFVGELSIRGTFTVLEPDAPNINVAMWTAESDAITCLDGAETSWVSLRQREPGTPSDWFVFGVGYRTVVSRAFERNFEEVAVVNGTESIGFPALVVLAGARRARLHKDRGECLFARTISLRRSTRVQLELEWNGNGAAWTVNRKRLSLDGETLRNRFQSATLRRGSFTILTNRSELGIDRLEVAGRLDPDWVSARARERARRELDEALAKRERP